MRNKCVCVCVWEDAAFFAHRHAERVLLSDDGMVSDRCGCMCVGLPEYI